jgi:hypothetical protein
MGWRGRRFVSESTHLAGTRPRSARTMLEDLVGLRRALEGAAAIEAERAHTILRDALAAGDVEAVRAGMARARIVLDVGTEVLRGSPV